VYFVFAFKLNVLFVVACKLLYCGFWCIRVLLEKVLLWKKVNSLSK